MSNFRAVTAPALLLVAGVCFARAQSPYGEPRLVCRFQDPRINESSGLAASSRSDQVLFTHNDSGDEARFFAVDRRNGETLAVYRVTGAEALDWEAMARGPGEKGASSLYLGDIGDNFRLRPTITVYRVPEPKVDPDKHEALLSTPRAARFEFVYDDGPHNAETLLVHPRTGQVVIVTKDPKGSGVYAAPLPLKTTGCNPLHKKAEVRFGALPRSAGAEQGSPLATGGDVSPDGRRVVVRTYSEAWEWTIDGSDLAGAFRRPPVYVRLAPVGSGEAIAYRRDGLTLLTSTEGKNAPVHELERATAP